tara:strand:- start:11194 stop:11469 length:276 start_codon:yes stop_codon:yes gene_type:complete
MKMALAQVGDLEFVRTEAYGDERLWIKVTRPGGGPSADIGVLVNKDGISLDVWPFVGPNENEPSYPAHESWLAWSDVEEFLGDHLEMVGGE